MILENLSKIGLSQTEIKVYLHLIKTGNSYANKISFETKTNRTNVYEALDRLTSKGLVCFVTKNRVKWFEASPPDAILSLVEGKEEELKAVKKDLLDDIGALKEIKPIKKCLEATVFVGKKGLRMVFEEILDEMKPISIIAAELQFKEFFGHYFSHWHRRRIKRGIAQRSIFPTKFRRELEKRDLLKYKFVDNKFTNPTTTIIYGDCCVFIEWSEEPVAIRVRNKSVSKSHLNYFNMLWNS